MLHNQFVEERGEGRLSTNRRHDQKVIIDSIDKIVRVGEKAEGNKQ